MLMNSVLTVGSNVPLAVSYPSGMSKERLIGYEANATVIDGAKDMFSAALEIGR